MARTRGINFENNESHIVIDFGTFALMMYYAKQIDKIAAKKMFDAFSSEYNYRMEYDLPLDGVTVDDEAAHFKRPDIEDVIFFIENKLTSALNIECQPLLEKYAGKENFFKLFHIDMGFLSGIGIERNEFYYDHPDSLIFYLNKLMDFLRYALIANQPYNVYVH